MWKERADGVHHAGQALPDPAAETVQAPGLFNFHCDDTEVVREAETEPVGQSEDVGQSDEVGGNAGFPPKVVRLEKMYCSRRRFPRRNAVDDDCGIASLQKIEEGKAGNG